MPASIFWPVYTIACIWFQSFLPGLDCFAPALIVCLHLKHYRTVFWLGLIWLLINEGVGSFAFGASLVWYVGLILFFFAVQVFFSSRHIYFVFVVALFAGIWQFFVYFSMVNLQELVVQKETLLANSVLTVTLFPVVWLVIQGLLKQNGTSHQYVQR